MNLLLDTAAFLWILDNSPRLSKAATIVLLSKNATHYLSHISLIEISIKYRKGKLALSAPPREVVIGECAARAINMLPLFSQSIFRLETLPLYHHDPFDRLLICQAITHNLTLITPDKIIRKYKVKTAW